MLSIKCSQHPLVVLTVVSPTSHSVFLTKVFFNIFAGVFVHILANSEMTLIIFTKQFFKSGFKNYCVRNRVW